MKMLRLFTRMQITLRKLNKRQRFTALTIIVTLGLIATQLVTNVDYYFPIAIALSLFSGAAAYIVFSTDFVGMRRITAVILLAFFTAAVSFFYFLLPVRWLTRLPMAMLYGVGYYAILLTENIFNIGTDKTIQLLRVARSIALLITLLALFLLFETVLSLHLNPFYNAGIVLCISFPLTLHSLWYMKLTNEYSRRLLFLSLLLALSLAEISLALSFWPIKSTMQALLLTTLFYFGVGVTQQELIERLFPRTLREFSLVALLVFLLALFTTSWTN